MGPIGKLVTSYFTPMATRAAGEMISKGSGELSAKLAQRTGAAAEKNMPKGLWNAAKEHFDSMPHFVKEGATMTRDEIVTHKTYSLFVVHSIHFCYPFTCVY